MMISQIKIDVLNINHITNCYILWDEKTKETAIIDPADKAQDIIEQIRYYDLKPKYVFLTHGHIDHTIALKDIMQEYGIKTVISKEEKDMLTGVYDDCSARYGVEQVIYNMDDFLLLEDGDEISLGETKVKLIHTPGHTKGCACFYVEKDNILITGDTLFYNCFGRCDLETASIVDMASSLRRIYSTYKDVHIFPGHGKIDVPIENTMEPVRELMLRNYGIYIGGKNENF